MKDGVVHEEDFSHRFALPHGNRTVTGQAPAHLGLELFVDRCQLVFNILTVNEHVGMSICGRRGDWEMDRFDLGVLPEMFMRNVKVGGERDVVVNDDSIGEARAQSGPTHSGDPVLVAPIKRKSFVAFWDV